MGNIEEHSFVGSIAWPQIQRKFLHSAGLANQQSFFDVRVRDLIPFRFNYLYCFSSYCVVLFLEIVPFSFIHLEKRGVFQFGFLNYRRQVSIGPYDYWSPSFYDSGLIFCDFFPSTSKQSLMIDAYRSDDRQFGVNNVSCIIPSSQSDLNRGEIALLFLEVEKS